ncbi:MAG TPA: DNA repair protein RecO [Polyangiaceae bacterium]|nr:DNA repair protein RecO [Polyangiaceae bacterium]
MTPSRPPSVHETSALVLRRVEFGEADLVLSLFTESLGRISALARAARKSRKRFAGSLEPFFTVRVRLDEPRSGELFVLREAVLVRPRTGLLGELRRLEAAGRALAWTRQAAPVRTPEPEAWAILEQLLDRLAAEPAERAPEVELAEAGLLLLGAFGWALELERCVRCGKPCPEDRAASADATRGGLVCRACGGGRVRLPASARLRLARAAAGEAGVLTGEEAELALDLVERVLVAHAGIDAS